VEVATAEGRSLTVSGGLSEASRLLTDPRARRV
jgi:hypothetical protein